MGGQYVILGRTFPAWQLSMATMATVAVGAIYASTGKKQSTNPPFTAQSSEEEKFIKDFVEQAEKGDLK